MKLFGENRLIDWGAIAAAALTAAGMLIAGIAYEVNMHGDVGASRAADADHEGRIRKLEEVAADMHTDVKVTRNDVGWIKQFLLDRQATGKDPAQTASNQP
jgi:hypothetical protein